MPCLVLLCLLTSSAGIKLSCLAESETEGSLVKSRALGVGVWGEVNSVKNLFCDLGPVRVEPGDDGLVVNSPPRLIRFNAWSLGDTVWGSWKL